MSNDAKRRDHDMTQKEVGEALNLHRNDVRQLERKALENFAKELAKRGFKMEDFLGEKK